MEIGYEEALQLLVLVLEKTGPVSISWKKIEEHAENKFDLRLSKKANSDDVSLWVEPTTGEGNYAIVNGKAEDLIENPLPILLLSTDDHSWEED